MAKYKSIEWIKETGSLRLLNQLILPGKLEYKDYTTADGIAEAIRDMTVRGAPAIGVAAAYGLLAAAHEVSGSGIDSVKSKLASADKILRASRPTAVNLFWALDEMAKRTQFESATDEQALIASLEATADAIAQEDVVINTSIGENAMSLMPEHKVTFIHHCNTGSLATVDYGTALGIIRMAHEKGLETNVFVDETRPRLQGARLTSWELQQLGIAHKLMVDGASSLAMQKFDVDMCVVGCDRVAANGDFANKIGTCNLATVAKANSVPFYVAAPLSTIDLSTFCGGDIEIEERDAEEVTVVDGQRVAPEGIDVFNPAFDITPAELITAIITEKGIVYPPFKENLEKIKGE